jgi:hypothetical protein
MLRSLHGIWLARWLLVLGQNECSGRYGVSREYAGYRPGGASACHVRLFRVPGAVVAPARIVPVYSIWPEVL